MAAFSLKRKSPRGFDMAGPEREVAAVEQHRRALPPHPARRPLSRRGTAHLVRDCRGDPDRPGRQKQ